MKTKIRTAAAVMILLTLLLSACQGIDWPDITEVNQVNFSPTETLGDSSPSEKEFTDPQEISAILADLAAIRLDHWQSQPQGWWHGQKTISSQEGNLHGVNMEWWFRFEPGGSCPQLLQTILAEDGGVLESNLLVRGSDLATAADAAPSSTAAGQPNLVLLPEDSCPDLLNLALERFGLLLDDTEHRWLESSQAVIRDGNLHLTLEQVGPVREVLMVTLDLETGFLVEETNRIYELEGDEFLGAITYTYEYEHHDELPADVRRQIEPALAF
ncbi:MAG: hypothetical protein PWQ55_1545 [Chloroflexota bacterium]|nr:hypothetical protein [Chloroflexota bacterium]